jgi:hypothetical protein
MLLRTKEKAPRVSTKCLIHWEFLVGWQYKFQTCDPCSVKGARATIPLQRCRNDTAIQVKNHLLIKNRLTLQWQYIE